MPNEKILIVDDEQAIADLINYSLKQEGYCQTHICLNGEDALKQAVAFKPDLIFLDLMLPGICGLDVCRALKTNSETVSIAIVMLTAKSEESDIVVGLELGADDYITKPFSSKLLIARMRAVLRRCRQQLNQNSEIAPVAYGPITLDQITRQVFMDGELISLTAGEFDILHLFLAHPGRVYTREQLVYQTRGDDYPVTERAVDVQILGLRRKLKNHAEMIETIRGIGYRLTEK